MGFFDKIKSAFIEEEEDDKPKPQAQNQPQAAPQPEAVMPGNQQVQMSQMDLQQPQGEGKINPELLQVLTRALKDFNLPGPDYLELKDIIDNPNFKQNIPDENQRIMSAFFSIQAGNPGFTKEVVLNSLNEYVSKMEGERNNAIVQLSQRVDEEITAPMQQVDEKRKRIEQLSLEIANLNQEIEQIQAAVEQKRAELNAKKLDFDVTINALIGALKADMVKIDSIIH